MFEILEKAQAVLDFPFPPLRPVQVSDMNQVLRVVQIFEYIQRHTLWPGLVFFFIIIIIKHLLSQPAQQMQREGSGLEVRGTPSPSKIPVLLSNAETAITKAAFECSSITLPTHTHTHYK